MRAHILTIETWNISLKRFSLYDYVFQPMFVIEYKSYTIQHNTIRIKKSKTCQKDIVL